MKKAPKAERTSCIKALQRKLSKHVEASARSHCGWEKTV